MLNAELSARIIMTEGDLYDVYRNDWNAFVRDVLGVRLDRNQRKIVRSVQTNRRTSVRSGHAQGKDFVAAVISLCFLYLNDPSKVINTAPTGRQVNSIMMSEIGSIHNRSLHRLGGELLKTRISVPGRPEWFLEGFKASDRATEAWTGLHSPNLLVVVTEASGIAQETFDAIEGILTGDSRLLIVFNPNQPVGESYRSTRSPRYEKFSLNCLNAVNVRSRKAMIPGQVDYWWVKDKVESWCLEIEPEQAEADNLDFKFEGTWYRPDDRFRVKVMGEYPIEDSNQLIPLAWFEAAVKRWKSIDNPPAAQLRLGVDIAGMGRDDSVFCPRYDNYVDKLTRFSKQDHMATTGRVKNALGDGIALVDTIGEGAGVHSRLIEQGVNSISAKFSEAAKDSRTGRDLSDFTGELKFANIRSYCYWAVRDGLNPANSINLALPDDDNLREELTEIKFDIRSDGSYIIEKKEDIISRLGRSPDSADGVALTYYPEEAKGQTNAASLSSYIKRT